MSEYIHKSHNVLVFVCSANYRRIVFCADFDESLKRICFEISKRYNIVFIETVRDQDDVYFLFKVFQLKALQK